MNFLQTRGKNMLTKENAAFPFLLKSRGNEGRPMAHNSGWQAGLETLGGPGQPSSTPHEGRFAGRTAKSEKNEENKSVDAKE